MAACSQYLLNSIHFKWSIETSFGFILIFFGSLLIFFINLPTLAWNDEDWCLVSFDCFFAFSSFFRFKSEHRLFFRQPGIGTFAFGLAAHLCKFRLAGWRDTTKQDKQDDNIYKLSISTFPYNYNIWEVESKTTGLYFFALFNREILSDFDELEPDFVDFTGYYTEKNKYYLAFTQDELESRSDVVNLGIMEYSGYPTSAKFTIRAIGSTSKKLCASNCNSESGKGECTGFNICTCNPGFIGQDCDTGTLLFQAKPLRISMISKKQRPLWCWKKNPTTWQWKTKERPITSTSPLPMYLFRIFLMFFHFCDLIQNEMEDFQGTIRLFVSKGADTSHVVYAYMNEGTQDYYLPSHDANEGSYVISGSTEKKMLEIPIWESQVVPQKILIAFTNYQIKTTEMELLFQKHSSPPLLQSDNHGISVEFVWEADQGQYTGTILFLSVISSCLCCICLVAIIIFRCISPSFDLLWDTINNRPKVLVEWKRADSKAAQDDWRDTGSGAWGTRVTSTDK